MKPYIKKFSGPMTHQFSKKALIICVSLFCNTPIMHVVHAQTVTNQAQTKNAFQRQEIGLITKQVSDYLETQVLGYPGQVTVNVHQIDPNVKLSSCDNLQAFMPSGSRAWGKTTVGVLCNGSAKWTIYVQATVNVLAPYLVSAAPLAQGTIISEEHLVYQTGDLTKLPTGIFTESNQVLGRIVSMSVPAGAVLRQNLLKLAPVVQRGQTVVVTSSGKGFKVAAEGQALANATEGQVVQVKVSNGQVVAGIASANGQIEVKF
jgi:flagella basal body P-ring formation protein FlgA